MFIFALEAAAERSYPTSKARGGSRGQGQWLGGATPRPRSGGCAGTGGPRGAILLKVKKGGGRRYPSSKVTSNSCALLEQP